MFKFLRTQNKQVLQPCCNREVAQMQENYAARKGAEWEVEQIRSGNPDFLKLQMAIDTDYEKVFGA